MKEAKIIKRDFPTEIVKALEAGANKHLNSSIFYSPLRFFYRKFEKNNPQTMNQARDTVKNDIVLILSDIPNFNFEIFIKDGVINPLGKKFLQRNYNIGINLLKKKLTLMSAFRVITNSNFRNQIYEFVLLSIRNSAIAFIKKAIK